MRNGSIAVAGAQVKSTPSVSRAVFLSHTSRCSVKFSSARGGAEAHDLQPGEVFGACRSGRRRWGARSAVQRRGDVFLGALGEGAGACSSINPGRPGALLGSSVAFGSGCG